MTDLEAHVAADGRADLVEQVRSQIDSLGVTYIYYQFVSVTGRIVGKGVPAGHWEQVADRGFQLAQEPFFPKRLQQRAANDLGERLVPPPNSHIPTSSHFPRLVKPKG